MKEIWKDITGYENYYQVSNLGRVKSKDRKVRNKNGIINKKGRILKLFPNNNGYLRALLVIKGIGNRQFAHRLVAVAFVPNTESKLEVNHKDSNFLNNQVDNLEWVTRKENMHHAINKGRMVETLKKLIAAAKEYSYKLQKPVIGTNVETGVVMKFNSIQEAGRSGFNAGGVCECCKGTRQIHKGYMWSYV